eukprot:gene2595-2897_t
MPALNFRPFSNFTYTKAVSRQSARQPAGPSPDLQLFYDNDYELQIPGNYAYLETPVVVVERGPQPERSPVLARFEPRLPGQPGSITILTRRATVFKQTIFQVSDISQLGDPIAVAKLVLPRGSTLLAASTQLVEQPAKDTPLGPVDFPPQTYYTFEFTTTTGMHVAMAASAKRGSVYLCGASTTAEAWPQAGGVFNRVVKSFRMRSQPNIS